MAMIEIGKKQFEYLLEEHISELRDTKDLEKIIMKILRKAVLFESFDWSKIYSFVNKEAQKQIKQIEW